MARYGGGKLKVLSKLKLLFTPTDEYDAVNKKYVDEKKLDKTGDAKDTVVTFEEATERANISTGEKMSTILGKIKKLFTDVKTVAFTGSYTDLTNKPTIPSVGNGTITIKQAGVSKGTFTTNQSGNTEIDLSDNNTTYNIMNGATTSTDGTSGLVPAPSSGDPNRYLRSDGTWAAPPDTDTWNPCTKDYDGYVTSGNGNSNKVWKTDENGNPAWRDEKRVEISAEEIGVYSKEEIDGIIIGLRDEINILSDKVDKMNLQLPKEITDWNYALDDANNTITLSNYTGSDTDVTVYANYSVDGKLYYTQIESNNNELEKYMFEGNETVQTITFDDKLDTSRVTHMNSMFSNCSNLSNINFGRSFNTSNVTVMERMFFNCNSLTNLDLSNFDTSNVIGMHCMFSGCRSLNTLDLNGFDTHNVTDMSSMFQGCSSLTSLDLTNFDTSNVIYMSAMFSGCFNLESLNLNSFDTSNVTIMSYMFGNCNSIRQLDLTSFDARRMMPINNSPTMDGMFSYCSRLTTILVDEDIWAWDSRYDETQLIDIFYGCGTSNVTFIDKGYI